MSSGANTPAGEPSPSGEDAPILALERFAALSADIDSGAARDEVIAREGLSVEAWTRAQESWLGKMADEASRKRFELTNRYNSAFVAQRRAEGGIRRGARKNSARVEPASAAPAPALVAPPPSFAAPPPSFVAPPPSFVAPPSFITSAPPYVEAPPTPFAASPPPYIEEPTPFAAPAPSFARALPFVSPSAVATPAVAAPTPIAIPAAPPAVAAMPTNLAGTVDTQATSPFASGAPPLPFKQARAVPPGPPPPMKPRSPAGHTIDGGVLPFTPGATPFAARDEKPASVPIKAQPRPVFDPHAPMDLSGTVVASSRDPVDAGGKLPFRAAPDAGARLPPPAAPPPRAGGGLPFRAAPPPIAAPQPPSAPRATRFSIEQFASLSAEIAVNPSTVAQVRGRYGLDDASHRAEAEEWGRRFTADKELFARYGALFQSYRDWLARSPR